MNINLGHKNIPLEIWGKNEFFYGKKRAKNADFGVFGTFLAFFEKISKIFYFPFYPKVMCKGCFGPKTLKKISKWQKIILMLKIFEKNFLTFFEKKSAKKADFGVFGTFLPFLKKFQNFFIFSFFQKLC